MTKKERRFETKVIETDKPIDLTAIVLLLVQKIKRGEFNDKRKV